MANSPIAYRGGYKYQLAETYAVTVAMKPARNIQSDFIDLDVEGGLSIKRGYAWDGPSGPTIDTDNFMRGSLVHDALYQLLRQNDDGEHFDHAKDRKVADQELIRICKEDGMTCIRRQWVLAGVRWGGRGSAKWPKEVKYAP